MVAMKSFIVPVAWAFGIAVSAPSAFSQVGTAQQRYERQIAACNSGSRPAPERAACIRAAGTALDNARGGPPAEVPVATPDGRATVVTPPGARAPATGAEVMTTPDGRATIVPPSDRSAPR